MAELADALDLGSSAREGVGVQVSPGARRISEMRTRFSDLVFPIGEIRWPLRQPVVLFTVGSHPHSTLMLRCVQPCWFDRAPTCTAPYPPRAGATVLPPALEPTCPRWRRARALPTRPAPVSPAAPALSAPANLYSTTPFLNAQITSCTRLCVPVFAIADDRWVFTVDGSKNRVAAISLLLIP